MYPVAMTRASRATTGGGGRNAGATASSTTHASSADVDVDARVTTSALADIGPVRHDRADCLPPTSKPRLA